MSGDTAARWVVEAWARIRSPAHRRQRVYRVEKTSMRAVMTAKQRLETRYRRYDPVVCVTPVAR